MTHFMRKHKTLIFWMLVLFVGFPMLFFGVDFTAMFDRLTGRDSTGLKPVAVVHGMPIPAEALLDELQQMAAQMPNATTEQLIQSGMADQALDRLINSALVEKELEDRKLTLTNEFIIERMKEHPSFQTPEGKFDPRLWNNFVKGQRERNWAVLYADFEKSFARELWGTMITASARVLESEVREEFEKANTQIQVKYVTVDPPIVPTEEQLAATYNASPDKYALPGERVIRFVEFPLVLPAPPLAQEVVDKARAGEDFAVLATQYSESNKETGGEIGWISRVTALGTHREPLFDLPVGSISDPLEGPGGHYIYKVENERTSELTQERDIFVREIRIAASLTPEERAAVRAKADGLHAKATELASLEKAALELGYTMKTSGAYRPDSTSIDQVHRNDTFAVKRFTESVAVGALAEVVSGQRNMYVAEVASIGEPTPRTLEEARDDVERDTIAQIRQSPERMAQVEQLGSDIKIQAETIEQIPAKFPELNAEIKETQPFTVQDMLFTQGIALAAQSIYAAVGDLAPGTMAGPLRGFDGSMYFVQLVQKTPPAQTAWDEKYPTEKEQLRERLQMMRENARLQDYLTLLREQSGADIQRDYEVFAQALGMNDPEMPESADAPAEAPEAEAPEAEASESTAPATEG